MGSPFFSETEFVEMGTGKVRLALDNGSLVEVIGSGTAGPLISYYLLEMAERMGLDPQIDIYIPRDFSNLAPCAYAMCGGKFSEALIQNLPINGSICCLVPFRWNLIRIC